MQTVIQLGVGTNRSQTRTNGTIIINLSILQTPDRLRLGVLKGALALLIRLAFCYGGEVFYMCPIHGNKF